MTGICGINIADVGLLVVDPQKREIRLEGDKWRWRVPAAAIQFCEVEVFIHQQAACRNKIYFVVLRVSLRGGFWEAPISVREASLAYSPRGEKRQSGSYFRLSSLFGVCMRKTCA